MSTEVLSVRIRKELKEEVERLKIDAKKVVEDALIRAVEEEKRKKISEAVRILQEEIEIGGEEWVRAVKESRRER